MGARDLLSISQVVELTGLQSSALRFYERKGLVEPVARAGGRRQYDGAIIHRIGAIGLLQEAGFTLAEIATLLGPQSTRRRWRSMAEERLREIDVHLARVSAARDLLVAALGCGCSGIDICGLVTDRSQRHRRALRGLDSVGAAIGRVK